MAKKQFAAAFLLLGTLSAMVFAQQAAMDRMNLFFGDWRDSASRMSHGTLDERDILTRGDSANPARKGAVLKFVTSYSFATLQPHDTTTSTRLDGHQEIFYVASGHGVITAGGEKAELFKNIAVLIPAKLDFTIRNSGDDRMTMYLINEPVPPGFRPNSKLLVRDENSLPITDSQGFWSHIVKTLFVTADGLGTLESILTVTLDPMTIGRPHVTPNQDIEEVWTSLEGNSIAFIGNKLRRQAPGIAYIHPLDVHMPHSNINDSEESQDKFLYFAHYHAHETRK
jgi:mannose-6-phosphate isomerase-like protein (cupin superfamily)